MATRKQRVFPGEEDKQPTPQRQVSERSKEFRPYTSAFKFVPDRLTVGIKDAIKAWEVTAEELDKALLTLFDQGYKVTGKYDEYSRAYAWFLMHTSLEHENSLMILTGRGSTPFKALRQLIFIHYKVWNETWSVSVPSDEYDD